MVTEIYMLMIKSATDVGILRLTRGELGIKNYGDVLCGQVLGRLNWPERRPVVPRSKPAPTVEG